MTPGIARAFDPQEGVAQRGRAAAGSLCEIQSCPAIGVNYAIDGGPINTT